VAKNLGNRDMHKMGLQQVLVMLATAVAAAAGQHWTA
jgi:hypothetical protein